MNAAEELEVMEADEKRLAYRIDNPRGPWGEGYYASLTEELDVVRRRICELRKWLEAQEADGA